MKPFYLIVLIIFLLWIFIKTLSYGKWTWDRKNRTGAIAIVIIALAGLILPIYSIFFMLK
ncbi:MAG TPA: hypothetical protein PK604_01260 [Acetivibrio clariflavus]|nr:hypothetical protein [Acetivibrio clariflavus]